MKILKYLKGHTLAVAIIVVLLIGQAFFDLSLPRYTSDIVDVGIQQSGVEDAAPSEMRTSTFDAIAMMLPAQDEEAFRAAYEATDQGTYSLTAEGKVNRAQLNDIVAFPAAVVYFAEQGAGASSGAQALSQSAPQAESPDAASVLGMAGEFDLSSLVSAYEAGMVSKDQVVSLLDSAKDSLGVNDSIISQQGVAAARAEYEALGYDMNAMQMSYLGQCALTMLGFVVASTVIAILVGFIASRTGAAVGKSLRSRLFSKVMAFSDAEVRRFSAASLITRGTNDIQQIQMMTIMLLRMLLYAPILAIGGVIMVAQTDLSMGWVIGVGIAAVLIVVVVLMAVAMPKFKMMQKLIDKVNLVAREMLTGVSVVRAFGRQEHEQQRFDAASTDLMQTQLFTNRVMTFMMPAMMLVMNALSAFIVWVGAGYIDAGTMQTGDLIAFITYSMIIIMSFLMLGMLAIIIPRADVAAGRIDEVLETPLSIEDPKSEASSAPRTAATKTTAGSESAESAILPGAQIAFNHVNFKYADSAENVLSDIHFIAEAGKTTAIIGSTGSGKSTIVKLIERFYDVADGSITIDGVDVRAMTQEHLRNQLGYVPQKAFLFTGTIESNIGYAEEAAGEGFDDQALARIRRAADIAQATEFIDAKPEGLQAPITQGGTNVSGGQRQRLAIARALEKDARAYLFDDCFSALDYKTDALLRQALATQMKGKTLIIVAQRIATVLHADKILVLDEGRIVGQGTHEELMKTCEQYREIALSQLSEAELEGGDAA